jgi:hypothetical protein
VSSCAASRVRQSTRHSGPAPESLPSANRAVRLVHAPPIPNSVAVWPRRLVEEWQEALDPAGDGALVNPDAALGEGDHVVREAVPREGVAGARGDAVMTATAAPALPAQARAPVTPGRLARAPQMIQRPPPYDPIGRSAMVLPPRRNSTRFDRVRTWIESRRDGHTTWRARKGICRLRWWSDASTGASVPQLHAVHRYSAACGRSVSPDALWGRWEVPSMIRGAIGNNP